MTSVVVVPVLPSGSPFTIEERVNFPGLFFDYVAGALDPKHVDGPSFTAGEDERPCKTYATLLQDVQFIYPEPVDPKGTHGTCAHAWFANRGEWIYALEPTQRNAFIPASFPEWLCLLSQRISAASTATRLVGNGWNCCLISFGTRSSWTFDEDPWHPSDLCVADLFVGQDVHITMSSRGGAGTFALDPASGAVMAWKGKDWIMTAEALPDKPFYHLSFRVIDPNRLDAQLRIKYAHRRADALHAEVRIVPAHLPDMGKVSVTDMRMVQATSTLPVAIPEVPEVKPKPPASAAKKKKKTPAPKKPVPQDEEPPQVQEVPAPPPVKKAKRAPPRPEKK